MLILYPIYIYGYKNKILYKKEEDEEEERKKGGDEGTMQAGRRM